MRMGNLKGPGKRPAPTIGRCAWCGKEIEIDGDGLFFCSTKCADMWKRQMSDPSRPLKRRALE